MLCFFCDRDYGALSLIQMFIQRDTVYMFLLCVFSRVESMCSSWLTTMLLMEHVYYSWLWSSV